MGHENRYYHLDGIWKNDEKAMMREQCQVATGRTGALADAKRKDLTQEDLALSQRGLPF